MLSEHQAGEEVSCPLLLPLPHGPSWGVGLPPCGGWGTWLSPKISALEKDARRGVTSGSPRAQATCTPSQHVPWLPAPSLPPSGLQ